MIHLFLFARSLKINSIHIVQECDANEAKLKFNSLAQKNFTTQTYLHLMEARSHSPIYFYT